MNDLYEKAKYLMIAIAEQREWGHDNVADLFAEDLKELMVTNGLDWEDLEKENEK